jgi:hypothetical protein
VLGGESAGELMERIQYVVVDCHVPRPAVWWLSDRTVNFPIAGRALFD